MFIIITGFEIQANRIPLRFLVKQLHDGCQIVLSGQIIMVVNNVLCVKSL